MDQKEMRNEVQAKGMGKLLGTIDLGVNDLLKGRKEEGLKGGDRARIRGRDELDQGPIGLKEEVVELGVAGVLADGQRDLGQLCQHRLGVRSHLLLAGADCPHDG